MNKFNFSFQGLYQLSITNQYRGRSRISSYGGGVHLKNLRRAEGGANIFGVFRVKNHEFTPKNHIFSNCGGRREHFWGISCEKSKIYAKKSYFLQLRREARTFLGYFVWKITILCQNIIFFPILGGTRAGCAPLDPPLQ